MKKPGPREAGSRKIVRTTSLLASIPNRKPCGGRRSRQKGDRAERALVRILQEAGFAAERVPLSGSAGGRFCADITVPLLGIDRKVEAKVRCDGFVELYRWLAAADLLIVKRDRAEPLVVLPIRFAIEIAKAAERSRSEVLR
jgi:Archaeal holliday junction resolvase (hjc)